MQRKTILSTLTIAGFPRQAALQRVSRALAALHFWRILSKHDDKSGIFHFGQIKDNLALFQRSGFTYC